MGKIMAMKSIARVIFLELKRKNLKKTLYLICSQDISSTLKKPKPTSAGDKVLQFVLFHPTLSPDLIRHFLNLLLRIGFQKGLLRTKRRAFTFKLFQNNRQPVILPGAP